MANPTELRCFRCGASLAALTLPLSRRDMCPNCSSHLHVCRQCEHYDAQVLGQCREEDAEEVREKDRVNFCEWFRPSHAAFDSKEYDAHRESQSAAEALFGGSHDQPANPSSLDDPNDLFK